jgi:hypothetical protein
VPATTEPPAPYSVQFPEHGWHHELGDDQRADRGRPARAANPDPRLAGGTAAGAGRTGTGMDAGWTGTARRGSSAESRSAPGSLNRSGRTHCGTRSSPPPSTPELPCGTCRKPPRTPTRARRCAMTGPAAASTGTPHTSSPPTLPEPPGKQLTAHEADSAWSDCGGQAEPGSRPACVTGRDPNSDHESPLRSPVRSAWLSAVAAPEGSI